LDRQHVWHPYTQHAIAPAPIPIRRAEGAVLVDMDGREIIDAISSWWVTLHGHAQPEIAEAIGRQAHVLEQVIFAGFTHEPAAMLAAELAERLPAGLTRVFFSDNGSTAVEVAIKIAMQYWQNRGERRPLIAALEHAYHGDTFGAMSASARGLFTDPYGSRLFDVCRLATPDDELPDGLAAVIVEPLLQGAGGMRMWSEASLRSLRERTTERGVLLIADEVLTGFGRTGPLFACQRADIVPDVICLSKGLTGGFLPMGATAVREEIFEGFLSQDRRHTLFHGHSFTANPIACAAARASLALLNEASARRRLDIEQKHRTALAHLVSHPRVSAPRVLGTVAAFNLGGAGYLSPVGTDLTRFALERGVLLRPLGDVVYVLPPYCTTDAQLDQIYGVINEFLA
ncbi:MAG TPA: adenosylmethionine--8-amino-7-oxononanoate transaminase, partial [Gemmatimonadaceae bacterium]|nr:adenosylmethionine--8-amino-7-oxononanoate transaminase [Gemmatimonadaceae bacterium]